MCSDGDKEAGNKSRMERLQCDCKKKVYYNNLSPSQK